jgi:hypothetical protein
MERPIDQIKKAEAAMKELLEAAALLRQRVNDACAQNPQETAELVAAAERFEKEVQRIDEWLQQCRRGIQ